MQTEQEKVLKELKQKYGPTAFATQYENYCRVGFKISAMGKTWQQAIEELERKLKP